MARSRFRLLLVVSLLFASIPITASPAAAAAPGDLVVNEIMNNPSAVSDSAGEWFEVHNPTGGDIDIEGWTIRDDGIDAHVISNGGPLVVLAGGYLVLGNNADPGTNGGVTVDYSYGSGWFLSNGDDEVILVDTAAVEIDRVEYDGGPSFPDPTGATMSLIDPALDNNIGANWCEATTPFGAGDLGTPGAANDCPPPPAPELVVNEIMNNPSAVSDANGEWFEIYNAGVADVDINGFTIRDDGADTHVISNGGPLIVAAGGYVVLGNNADPGTNGGVTVDYSYGSGWFLSNGDDEVILEDASLTEIDRVEYDGGPSFPDPNGATMSLIDPALDNNVGANWCEAATPFGAGDLGTPAAANDCDSGPGDPAALVINEIMNNPSAVSDANGEWFEVYNPGADAVDIEGWTIRDDDFDSHVIVNGGPLVVPAAGFAILGRNADSGANGGVSVDYQYSNFFLGNSGDEVILVDTTATEIDRVEYDGGPNFPDPNGASMSLQDPTLDNNVGANWCEATTPFGAGDLGTPGAANDCPPPPAPELLINEIMNNPAAVSDSNGEWFEIYNAGGAAVDLAGFTIEDNDFDSHVIAGQVVVPAGGYVTLGRNADSGANGGVSVDYQYSNFFLSNGADEVVLRDTNLTEVDRVEYDGGPAFPDPNGATMSLRNPSFDNNVGANWCEATTSFGDGDSGTPGSVNDCVLFIHEVQGSGPVVAISGPVVVEAIVTSLLEDDDVLDGFLLQEEDADADADPATSEGIRVDCGAACPSGLAVGDLVRVFGSAGESFGMSEINANSGSVVIGSSANPLPTPSVVSLPAPGGTDEELTFEPLEGMLVQFTNELFVSEYFELARFGQVVLTADERPFQFTHTNAPSVAGYSAFLDDLATRRIVLDDDNNDQNDAIFGPTADTPYYWERPGFSTTNFFRGGDSITNLTGGLDWAFGEWRVKAAPSVFDYSFTPNEARTSAPEPVGGTLKVASFNVLNYFTTIDTGAPICGPSGTLGCRGANSDVELDRQRDKIVAALAAIDADIVGLVELENNADASLSDLVGGLNAVVGADTYDYVDTGTIGADVIKVGLIYKPAAVAPIGDFAILDSSVDPNFIDTKNRPVLVQTFEEIASAARVTVAVNHMKSKGTPCDDVGDPNIGDGQGNCNQTRTSAVDALVDYLATDPTATGDPDFLIIGDLNAYAMEDPITTAEAAGYTDLIEAFNGIEAYSFVFDGQLGYLDHALGNASVLDQVTGVTEWRINSDEVNVLDYNDGIRDPGEQAFERKSNALPIYEADPYRSSDHDPLVVGLALDTPRSLKEQVLAGLEALPPPEEQTVGMQVEKAIESVAESLDPDSWETDSIINTKKVFDQERQAVVQLMLVVAADVPEAAAAQAAIDVLVDADRQLAQVELYAAIARGGSASRIADAQAAMAEAAALVEAGVYNEAINAYKAAWDAATKA